MRVAAALILAVLLVAPLAAGSDEKRIACWSSEPVSSWRACAKRQRENHVAAAGKIRALRSERTARTLSARSSGSVEAARATVDPCLDELVYRESRWVVTATNPSSGAYGLPQALPGSKMASAGPDWRTNPFTQLRWMRGYVAGRYGGSCAALAFQKANGWY